MTYDLNFPLKFHGKHNSYRLLCFHSQRNIRLYDDAVSDTLLLDNLMSTKTKRYGLTHIQHYPREGSLHFPQFPTTDEFLALPSNQMPRYYGGVSSSSVAFEIPQPSPKPAGPYKECEILK